MLFSSQRVYLLPRPDTISHPMTWKPWTFFMVAPGASAGAITPRSDVISGGLRTIYVPTDRLARRSLLDTLRPVESSGTWHDVGEIMLLRITTTYRPATDLGYLLHKNPTKCQEFGLSFGAAHVFYPVADENSCTAALLLDVDPVGLIRGRHRKGGLMDQYVNDRPFAASSFLSVAIAQVYGSALGGRSKERPELAETAIPLKAEISVLPSRGGEGLLRRLFEPLGYKVDISAHPLDEAYPDWGESPYYTVRLTRTCTLQELLTHLYVLVPVLDNYKHYYIGDQERQKLLAKGEGW